MAATRRQAGPTVSSGRRGYLRYQFGNHYWIPETQASWERGMVRDTAREAIPAGAVYDSADYLLHQPGVAQKRGGTSYLGPAMSGVTFATSLGLIGSTAQVLAAAPKSGVGELFKTGPVGPTTDIGALNALPYFPITQSPGGKYAIITYFDGSNAQKYDGSTISTLAAGMALHHTTTYKSRLVGTDHTNLNRLLFSPTPDVNATWDTSNAFIDCDHIISGLASLNNSLLVFSGAGMERIIGATPPPNSDMDRAPVVGAPGCTDSRSIVVAGPGVFFANADGVYLTNGTTPVCLTDQGGIGTYWRNLLSGYVANLAFPFNTSWSIAAGYWRGFLFVSVLDNNQAIQASLMCYVATRAWWRLSNFKAMAYLTAANGSDLYYADGGTNRVVSIAGIFTPAAGNKNDADGTAVQPTIEFAPFGAGPGVKSYGFGRLDYDLRDAAADNPSLAVTVKRGVEADTSVTPPESPVAKSTTLARKRFTIGCDAQAVTIALAQTGPSAKTELYAVEVEGRPQSLVGDGLT